MERAGHCYASTHNMEAMTLAAWSKNHEEMPKEQFLSIMKELVVQLKQFHKTEEQCYYQYVNPYAFIVSKEEQVFLLDIHAEENEQLLKFMQKRIVRERFLPGMQGHCKKGDVKQDIYGIGRTFQYLLATIDTEPELKKKEEQKFQKIISNCLSEQSKHPYRTCQDILKQLPKTKSEKYNTAPKNRKSIVIILTLFMFLIISYQIIKSISSKKQEATLIKKEKIVEHSSENHEKQTVTQMELGLVYLVEFKNYEKSLQVFSEIEENPLAKNYVKLTNFLWKGQIESGDSKKEEMKELLKEIERLIPDKQNMEYYSSLLEGYKLLDDLSAVLEKIRIGEYCLSLKQWEENEESKREKEIRNTLAAAYEENHQTEESIGQYDKLLELETEQEIREGIIQKISVLYEAAGNREKALETCARGLELYPNSSELCTLYIRMQCENTQISQEELVAVITKILQETPDILQHETFQKVQQEQGIRIEGEKIWIEK